MPSTPGGDGEAITLVVTMPVKAEREAEFLDLCARFAEWVHANEPETLLYVLTKHPSREHTYVWVERYRDEAAMTAHRESPQLAETLPKVRECLDGAPELLRLEQVVPR
jgi:quinol monooxygenase YgiN